MLNNMNFILCNFKVDDGDGNDDLNLGSSARDCLNSSNFPIFKILYVNLLSFKNLFIFYPSIFIDLWLHWVFIIA